MIFWWILGFVGSFLAGIINTFAGNGSSITLYLLMDVFGLPPNAANATNRLGIFAQGAASVPQLLRKGYPNWQRSGWIIGAVGLGALGGLITALFIDDAAFRQVFKFLILFTLLVVLVKPERWLKPQAATGTSLPWYLTLPIFLVLGFYGGFIQLGMGLFFLMLTVLGLKFDLVEANASKIIATTLYTALAIILFWHRGWVDWQLGLIFALGQALGGFLAVRYLTASPKASLWAYRILVGVVLFAVVRLFVWG